jgi:hypothetical protein
VRGLFAGDLAGNGLARLAKVQVECGLGLRWMAIDKQDLLRWQP